ncbi:YehR family protein [Gracilibacillus suaedae]|uniref:YehR family protein n=1 Tax=Gracilibacillus suaedae TaxID=2820273 RepID=UPI001ABEA511|nr:YehR family protein [Gracilibacillus suaedae]
MKKWMMFCLALLIGITLVACNSDDVDSNGDNREADSDSTETTENNDEETDTEDLNEATMETDNDTASSELDIDPDGENNVTLQLEQEGMVSKIAYKAEGDRVIKQTGDTIIPYNLLEISDKEEAEAMFEQTVAQYQDIEGLSHSIDYQDDQIVETTKVDFETADPDEIAGLTGVMMEDGASDFISLQRSVQMLQEQGYEIITE